MKYGDLSILQKIIVNNIVILLFSVVVYFIIFGAYANDAKSKEIQLIGQLNQQAVDSVNSYVGDLEQLTRQPLFSSDIMNSLRTISRDKALATDSRMLYDLTNRVMEYKKNINSTFIFGTMGETIAYSLSQGQLARPYNPVNEEWFKRCLRLNGAAYVSGNTTIMNILPKEPADKSAVFAVSRAIKDFNSIDILGVISIFSDINPIRDTFNKITSVKGEELLILDSDNREVYDSDERNIGKDLSSARPDLAFIGGMRQDIGNAVYNIAGQSSLLTVSVINSANWRFVRVIPENALLSNVTKARNRLIAIAAALTCLSLLMSFIMSLRITKPLKKLTEAMKTVESGELKVRFNTRRNDEIGRLGNGFNNMLAEIERLIKDIYDTSVKKREAETDALQAQINPHFIYNTLESIRMMARINNDPETAKMIFILGKLLRYSINIKNYAVNVREEIENLENYMVLQNFRFENQFRLETEIPEQLLDASIIKLVFQPIVENAVLHAFNGSSVEAVITVKGIDGPTGIRFEISDNGTGMSDEQVNDLERAIGYPADSEKTGQRRVKGVGLRNVNERIILYFGEDFGLTISSVYGAGTTVTLKFPPIGQR